jgi:hypothetical protein
MGRKKVAEAEIDTDLLAGSWKRLVLSAPHLEVGEVDWKAYSFCVLEQVHRLLRRKEVFAVNSSKWSDPRAKQLTGPAWEQARPTVLASLGLPANAAEHLAARAALLDGTYRDVAARLPANAQISTDADGRLHFAALEPEAEGAALVALRQHTAHHGPRGRNDAIAADAIGLRRRSASSEARAAHSAISSMLLAPDTAAQAQTRRIAVSEYQRPRLARGSGTRSRKVRRSAT